MNKYLLIGCCFLFGKYAISQTIFQKKVNFDGYSIQQTIDGGFVMCGSTLDSSNAIYVAKTDYNGDTLWTKKYIGEKYYWSTSVQQTFDHGFIIAGGCKDVGIGINNDICLLKIDSIGNVSWLKIYSDSLNESVFSVQQTMDSGYVVAGNVKLGISGQEDINIVKYDFHGNVIWAKIVGGINDDYAKSISQTTDEGYIIAGSTASFGAGSTDAILIKMSRVGIIQWAKTFGSVKAEGINSVRQTVDGGYILSGYIQNGGTQGLDIYIIKTDSTGNVS